MVSLKEGRGKVPIRIGTQHEATSYILVDFPTRKEFDYLYKKHNSNELKDKYWGILLHRSRGFTLADSGKPYGITRERVRQIEARFQRMMSDRYTTQFEANLAKLSEHRSLVESFLNSVTLEKFLLADDNR
jgi:hypothetical protein